MFFFQILVESLKIESLNDANKLATTDLLKIKVFWKKSSE